MANILKNDIFYVCHFQKTFLAQKLFTLNDALNSDFGNRMRLPQRFDNLSLLRK